jgi:hypothetical protein
VQEENFVLRAEVEGLKSKLHISQVCQTETKEQNSDLRRDIVRWRGKAAACSAAAAVHAKAIGSVEATASERGSRCAVLEATVEALERREEISGKRIENETAEAACLRDLLQKEQQRAGSLANLLKRREGEISLLKHVQGQKDRHITVLGKEKARLQDSMRKLQEQAMMRRRPKSQPQQQSPLASSVPDNTSRGEQQAAQSADEFWGNELRSQRPPPSKQQLGEQPPPSASPTMTKATSVHVSSVFPSPTGVAASGLLCTPTKDFPPSAANRDDEVDASTEHFQNKVGSAKEDELEVAEVGGALDKEEESPFASTRVLLAEVPGEFLATTALVAQLRKHAKRAEACLKDRDQAFHERDRALAKCVSLTTQIRNLRGRVSMAGEGTKKVPTSAAPIQTPGRYAGNGKKI